MSYTVRRATMDDACYLSSRLRAEDVAELRAASGRSPFWAIVHGVERGPAWVGVDDEGPYGIFGVVPHQLPKVGVPWMVATDRLERHQLKFLRECKAQVENLARGYDMLTNLVDARNEVHIKWLRWAGFTFINRHERFGVEQRPFYEFVRITHV